MSDGLDQVIREWTRLGAGFGAAPAARTPDLERLLLDTARRAPEMARLFVMAATWLHEYGDLIATHRLKRLIRDELEMEAWGVLGLLLETAQRGTHPAQFATVIKALRGALEKAVEARPLFEVERASAALVERARRRATAESISWGVWCGPIELHAEALRSTRWVMQQNPELIVRADFRGDLRASILASLEFDAEAGASELHLARAAGGSRAQVRNALDNLEMTGRVVRERRERRMGIRLAGVVKEAG